MDERIDPRTVSENHLTVKLFHCYASEDTTVSMAVKRVSGTPIKGMILIDPTIGPIGDSRLLF